MQALVEREEVFDAFALRREAYTAVETIHGSVQRLMGSAEIRGRHIRVVEVRERCAPVTGSGVEHRVSMGGEAVRLGVPFSRERERVVDEADGVAVVALQPPADVPQPRHVHG